MIDYIKYSSNQNWYTTSRKSSVIPVIPSPSTTSVEPQPIEFPENTNISERIQFLENKHKDLKERVTAVRGSGGDSSGLEKQAIQATKDLYDMRFLMADSFIDDRYRLLVEIGNGQTSVVWKATDQRSGKPVAIKFLKYKYINDKSIIEGFSKGANTMNTVRHQNIPAVLENYLIIEMGKKGVQLILDAGFEARQHADQQYWKGQCTFSNKRCGFEAGLIE